MEPISALETCSCCRVTRSCVSSKFLKGQPWCSPAAGLEAGPLMILAHECGLQSCRLPSRPYWYRMPYRYSLSNFSPVMFFENSARQ